jgi:hypothetical protein
LLTAVGVDLTVPATALSSVIDDALLAFGVAYADLASAEVADADVLGFQAVLRLTGLRFAHDEAISKVDVTISDPNVSKKWSQLRAGIEASILLAEKEAAPYIAAMPDFETGAITFGDRLYPPGIEPWQVA